MERTMMSVVGSGLKLRGVVLVMVALLSFLSLDSVSAMDAWQAERAQVRQQREQLREQAAADRLRRANEAAQAIDGLLAAAEQQRIPGQDQVLTRMIEALERMDESQAQPLRQRQQALPAEPEVATRMEERTWQRAMDRAKRQALTRTGQLLNRSIHMGLHDLAHGFLHEILAFDPDNAAIRRGLGQVAVEGMWLDRHAQAMARQGFIWDDSLGWVMARELERYSRGEYYDLQDRRWTTLEAANERRSQVAQRWQIRTSNVLLHSTLPLNEAVAAARKLEDFYAGIFAAFAAFFTDRQRPDDYRIVMGLLEHPPLEVWIYRDREQFRADALSRRVNAPEWSAGFWSSALGASFFYGTSDTVLYHEFTHQIVSIFAGRNRSPVWITEGLAGYCETPSFAHGQLILGRWPAATDIHRHLRHARAGTHVRIHELLALNSDTWRAAEGDRVHRNYDAAAALTWFCMEIDQRRYRSDFVDFVRDSYHGTTAGRHLWEYMGMTRGTFIRRYEEWEASAAIP